MISILQSLAEAGIWFLIVWLPILLALGLLAGIGLWIVRRTGIGRRPRAILPPPPPPGEALAGGS